MSLMVLWNSNIIAHAKVLIAILRSSSTAYAVYAVRYMGAVE